MGRCEAVKALSVSGMRRCHLSRGERQERTDAGLCCIRRGDVGIAPYTRITVGSTHVGDGLRTSRELKHRLHPAYP